MHQGLALKVPPYEYAHPIDLLDQSSRAAQTPLFVALDGITDPRNLGAIIRSTAAFGGQGVIVPQRRSVGVTASAWKTSAGAAARTARRDGIEPHRRRSRRSRQRGVFVLGLDGGGDVVAARPRLRRPPVVIVVGSEGKGLSRLVTETCDAVVSIPITAATESLNAGIAASVTLYEISKLRAAQEVAAPSMGSRNEIRSLSRSKGRQPRSDLQAPVVVVVGLDGHRRRPAHSIGSVIVPVGGSITVASSRRWRSMSLM